MPFNPFDPASRRSSANADGGAPDIFSPNDPNGTATQRSYLNILRGEQMQAATAATEQKRAAAEAVRLAKRDPLADAMTAVNQRRTNLRLQQGDLKNQLHAFVSTEGVDLFESDPISKKPIKNPDGSFVPKMGAEIDALKAKTQQKTGLIGSMLSSRKEGDPTDEATMAQKRLTEIEPAYRLKMQKFQRIQDQIKGLTDADQAHQSELADLARQREARFAVTPQDVAGAVQSVNATRAIQGQTAVKPKEVNAPIPGDRAQAEAEKPSAYPKGVYSPVIDPGTGQPTGGRAIAAEAIDAQAKTQAVKLNVPASAARTLELARLTDDGVTHVGDQPLAEVAPAPDAVNEAKLAITVGRIKSEIDKIDSVTGKNTTLGAASRDRLLKQREVYANLLDKKMATPEYAALGTINPELKPDADGNITFGTPAKLTPRVLVQLHQQMQANEETMGMETTAPELKAALQQQNELTNARFMQGMAALPSDGLRQRVVDLTRDPTLWEKTKNFVGRIGEGIGSTTTDTGESVLRNASKLVQLTTPRDSAVNKSMVDFQSGVKDFAEAMREEAAGWGSDGVPKEVLEKMSGSLSGSVGQGIGSTVAFMAPTVIIGGVGKLAGLSEKAIGRLMFATVAASGAASESNNFRREAETYLKPDLESGKITQAEFDRSLGMAELFGAAAGSTEAFTGISRMAKRIGSGPVGKSFLRSLFEVAGKQGAAGAIKWMRGAGAKAAVDVGSEMLEEMTQEYLQNRAENIYASKTFDPTRPAGWLEDGSASEAAGSAGVSTLLLSTLTQAFRLPRSTARYKALGEAVNRGAEDRRNQGGQNGQPPGAVPGAPVTPPTAPAAPTAPASPAPQLTPTNAPIVTPTPPAQAPVADTGDETTLDQQPMKTFEVTNAKGQTATVEAARESEIPGKLPEGFGPIKGMRQVERVAPSAPADTSKAGMEPGQAETSAPPAATPAPASLTPEGVKTGQAVRGSSEAVDVPPAPVSTAPAPTPAPTPTISTEDHDARVTYLDEQLAAKEITPKEHADLVWKTPLTTIKGPNATEVRIFPGMKNGQKSGFNAVMVDTDSGESIGVKTDFPTIEAAHAAGTVMLNGPKTSSQPAAPSAQPQKPKTPTPAPAPAATPSAPKAPPAAPAATKAPAVARGANKPATFIKAVAQASGLKAKDKATKFLQDFAPRLHKANAKAFEDMEVHVLNQAEWDATAKDPVKQSAAAYNPETNTLYFNSDKMTANDGADAISAVVHEAGHFAEKFALGEEFTQREWEKLTNEQRNQAWKNYRGNDEIDAKSLLKNRQARAEWVAMQFARVVRGDTDQMAPTMVAKLKSLLEMVRDLVRKWIGDKSLTTKELDAKILEMLGYIEKSQQHTLVGQNTDGKNVYQDERGVRHIEQVKDILVSEPVGMRPTRGANGGVEMRPEPRTAQQREGTEFETVTEKNLRRVQTATAPATTPASVTKPAGEGATSTTITPPAPKPVTPGISAEADKALDDAFDGLLGTPPEGIAQEAIPDDKIPAFMAAARALIKSGIRTPEAMARVLETKYKGAVRKYSESLWDAFGMSEKALRGTHDWNAIYATIDKPAATEAPATETAPTAEKPAFTPLDVEPKSEDYARTISNAVMDRLLKAVKSDGAPMTRKDLNDLAAGTTLTAKEVDEAAELGIVRAARAIASMTSLTPEQRFDAMVKLYDSQPNLTAKTSTSKINQAYSTPAPIAYLGSQLADLAGGRIVLEPTAGNGMGTIETNPNEQVVRVNEIDPVRVANLEAQGFSVTQMDASTNAFRETLPSVDRMFMNPPFGALKENGESKKFSLFIADAPNLETTSIDLAIVNNTLRALAEDGKAVLIIGSGAGKAVDPAERAKAYIAGVKQSFFFYLYGQYNVTDHFSIDGDLYAKQGAGWPIDVIVIDGKGKSALSFPWQNPPALLTSWNELRNKLTQRARGADAGLVQQDSQPGARPPVSRPAGDSQRPAAGVQPGGKPDAGKPGKRPTRAGNGGTGIVAGPQPDAGGITAEPDGPQSPRPESTGPRGGEGSGLSGGAEAPATDVKADTPIPVETNATGMQATYVSRSGAPQATPALTPVNLVTPTARALQAVESRRGNLDDFVTRELGYANKEELFQHFDAGQIDAIALGLDNVLRGGALITGDQTGMGKGRTVAAMMRYAVRQGMTPVFVTKNPGLYADMLRDLEDIGSGNIKPFLTNSSENVRLEDRNGLVIKEIKSAGSAKQRKLVEDATITGKLPDGAKVIFTTYDQIKSDWPAGYKEKPKDAFKRKRGRLPKPDGRRMKFLRKFAQESFVILDEAHLAGGESDTGWRVTQIISGNNAEWKPLAKGGKPTGIYYSSATYAKAPKNMGVYFETNVKRAVSTPAELAQIMEKGGVPLQQVLSSMLAQDGQYIRRELDFTGVDFKTTHTNDREGGVRDQAIADRERKLADSYTEPLREIITFNGEVLDMVTLLNSQLLVEGIKTDDGGTLADQLSGTNFGDQIHNMVRQYLLAIKADGIADAAVRALRAGKSPVIAVHNTMESVLGDLDAGGYPPDFDGLLLRYLDKATEITIKRPNGDKQKIRINLENISASFPGIQNIPASVYARAQQLVRSRQMILELVQEGSRKEIPVSPIDHIRGKIEAAGFKFGEISGRQTYLNDAGKVAKRNSDDPTKAGQNKILARFNRDGQTALLLTVSGSTGISAHASEKFKNQQPRVMIVGQILPDINDMIQMFGRVFRKGQVRKPEYEILNTTIPAELRLSAILSLKLSSLNANTTSAGEGVNSGATGGVDFLNKYGDEIVYDYLAEHPEIVAAMRNTFPSGLDPKEDLAEGDWYGTGDFSRSVTGEIAVLPYDDQQAFYAKVLEEYDAKLAFLDEIGENDLKAQNLPLEAETIEKRIIFRGSGDSVFDGSAYLETVKVRSSRKPLTAAELPPLAQQNATKVADERKSFVTGADALIAEELAAVERKHAGKPDMGEIRARHEMRALQARTQVNRAFTLFDQPVLYTGSDGSTAIGYVTDVMFNPEKPLTPSAHKVVVHLNTEQQKITLPASQVAKLERFDAPDWQRNYTNLLNVSTVKRIVTGNLIGGYGTIEKMGGEGRVVTYTSKDGEVLTGILMPNKFNPASAISNVNSGAELVQAVRAGNDVTSAGGAEFTWNRGEFEVRVPASKSAGGKYWQDQRLLGLLRGGEMRQVGSQMVGNVKESDADKLVQFFNKGVGDQIAFFEKPKDDSSAAPGGAPAPLSRAMAAPTAPTAPESATDAPRGIPLSSYSMKPSTVREKVNAVGTSTAGVKFWTDGRIMLKGERPEKFKSNEEPASLSAGGIDSNLPQSVEGEPLAVIGIERDDNPKGGDRLWLSNGQSVNPSYFMAARMVYPQAQPYANSANRKSIAWVDPRTMEVLGVIMANNNGVRAPAWAKGSTLGTPADESSVDPTYPAALKFVYASPGDYPEYTLNVLRQFERAENRDREKSGKPAVQLRAASIQGSGDDSRNEGRGVRDLRGRVSGAVAFQRALRDALKKNVIFFSGMGDKSARGFTFKDDANTILVNVEAEAPLAAIVGHEVAHNLKAQNLPLWEKARALIGELAGPVPQKYTDQRKAQGYKTDANVLDEWVSDFMGQRFDEPEFWQDVQKIAAERGQSAEFQDFARSAYDWLTNLGRKLRRVLTKFADRNTVERMEELRKGLASVLNDYAEQMPEAGYPNDPTKAQADTGQGDLLGTPKTDTVWSGVVDLRDGAVESTFTYKQAEASDFHHSLLVKPSLLEKIDSGDAAYFWIENGTPTSFGGLPPAIVGAIKRNLGLESDLLGTPDERATAADVISLAKELDPRLFNKKVSEAKAFIAREAANGMPLSPRLQGDQVTLAAESVLRQYREDPRAMRLLELNKGDSILGTPATAQRISSADTSLQQVPALFKSPVFVPNGTNLDIGAGKYDLGKNYLETERGVSESVPFDPYNRASESNRAAVERLQSGERFGTVTVPNVLNVIAESGSRANVIQQAARALRKSGTAFFQIYEGDGSGSGRETSKGFQNNRKTADYVAEVKRYFGTVERRGNIIVADAPLDVAETPWMLSGDGPTLLGTPPEVKGTAAQETILSKVNGTLEDKRTLGEKFRDYLADLKDYVATELKQKLLDSFASIKRLERANFGNQANIDASASAYKAARLTKNLPSVMDYLMKSGQLEYRNGGFAMKAGGKGLMQILKPLIDSGKVRLWEGYVTAFRANRLLAEGKESNFGRTLDPVTGQWSWDAVKAQQEINELLALAQQHPELETVRQGYADFQKGILDVAESAGLIDPAARALWEKSDYVPFYRIAETLDGAKGPRKKNGIADQRSGIKQLKGGAAPVAIMENIVRNVEQMIDASFKNVAMQRVADLAANNTDMLVRIPYKSVPFKASVAEVIDTLEKAGIDTTNLALTPDELMEFVKFWRMKAPKGKDVVSVMVGGKPIYYRVKDAALLRSVQSMGPRNHSWWMNVLMAPKQVLTAAVTLDPAFMAANTIRDSFSAWVVSDTPLRPGLDAAKGFLKALRNDPSKLGIMAAGGGSGHYNNLQGGKVRDYIRQLTPAARKSFLASIIDTPAKAARLYMDVGRATENANRIAIADSVRKNGGTDSEAAFQALDIMDFGLRGDSTALNFFLDVVPFLNARIQGLYRLGRGLKEDPRRVATHGAIITGATMALLASNWDDDKYWSLPEWERDVYYHFWVGGQHIRIPKPFEVGQIFSTVPERMFEFMGKTGDGKLLAKRMLSMVGDTFAMNPLPQIIKPAAERAMNLNTFTGGRIISRGDEFKQPEQQFSAATSETLRELAKAMPDSAPDWMRSPKTLEHFARGYFGSLGMYALTAGDALTRAAGNYPEDPAMKTGDFWVMKRFAPSSDTKETKYVSQFYDLHQEITGLMHQIKELQKNEPAQARELAAQNADLLGYASRSDSAYKVMQGLRKEEAGVFGSNATPEQKRDQLAGIAERRNRTAQTAMQASPRAARPWFNPFASGK